MSPRLGLQVLVGVPEGSKLRAGGVRGERVSAQHVDVFRDQRRQSLYVLVGDGDAAVAEFGERGVQIAGVPQDDRVQHQTECAELVFLAFPVGLAYLPPPAMEDEPGQGVPGFLQR